MNDLRKEPKSFKSSDIVNIAVPFAAFFLFHFTLPAHLSMIGGYSSLVLFPIVGLIRRRIFFGGRLTFEGHKAVRLSIALILIIAAGIIYEGLKILRYS